MDALHKAGGTFRVVMSLQDAKGSEFVQVLKTATELKMQVEEVAKKIEEHALSVTEALERNRLATLGWMMKQGLLFRRCVRLVVVSARANGHVTSPRWSRRYFVLHNHVLFVFADDANTSGLSAKPLSVRWQALDAM